MLGRAVDSGNFGGFLLYLQSHRVCQILVSVFTTRIYSSVYKVVRGKTRGNHAVNV